MDDYQRQEEQTAERPRRPQLLNILCILSFIGSGMSGASFLMVYSSYNEVIPALSEFAESFPGMEMLLTAGRGFFLTGFVLYFLSVIGVSLMWRMRKAGFHFYTGSQLMILLLPLFYIEGYPLPFFDAVITGLFIFLYSRFYKMFV